jgi:hypothetical protein
MNTTKTISIRCKPEDFEASHFHCGPNTDRAYTVFNKESMEIDISAQNEINAFEEDGFEYFTIIAKPKLIDARVLCRNLIDKTPELQSAYEAGGLPAVKQIINTITVESQGCEIFSAAEYIDFCEQHHKVFGNANETTLFQDAYFGLAGSAGSYGIEESLRLLGDCVHEMLNRASDPDANIFIVEDDAEFGVIFKNLACEAAKNVLGRRALRLLQSNADYSDVLRALSTIEAVAKLEHCSVKRYADELAGE